MLLLVGAVCAGMGQTIVFSVLPPLARELGLSNLQTGLIFAISATCWVLCGPVWGRLSDVRGRKPFIVIGMLGYAFSMVIFGGSIQLGVAGALSGLPLYLLLVATRSIYGLVGAAGPPAAQAYIADRTSKRDRTAGIASFSAAFGFGAMLGPGFGAATMLLGRVAPFYAAAALGFIMMLAVIAFLPERTGPSQRRPQQKIRIGDPRLAPFLIFALGMSNHRILFHRPAWIFHAAGAGLCKYWPDSWRHGVTLCATCHCAASALYAGAPHAHRASADDGRAFDDPFVRSLVAGSDRHDCQRLGIGHGVPGSDGGGVPRS